MTSRTSRSRFAPRPGGDEGGCDCLGHIAMEARRSRPCMTDTVHGLSPSPTGNDGTLAEDVVQDAFLGRHGAMSPATRYVAEVSRPGSSRSSPSERSTPSPSRPTPSSCRRSMRRCRPHSHYRISGARGPDPGLRSPARRRSWHFPTSARRSNSHFAPHPARRSHEPGKPLAQKRAGCGSACWRCDGRSSWDPT